MRRETTTPFRRSLTVCKCCARALAVALTPASCAGAVAEEAAREPSGGHDSGKARVASSLCAARRERSDSRACFAQKPRAQAREERRLDGADYLSRHGLSHTGAPGTRRTVGCERVLAAS